MQEWTHRPKADVRMVSCPVAPHFRGQRAASIKIMVKVAYVTSPEFMDTDNPYD